MICTSLDRFRDVGLLILRAGIGAMFVYHGYPKIAGGPEGWAGLGKAATGLGAPGPAVFWGFCAALSEFGGGILLGVGFLFRPAAFLLLCTMTVATLFHVRHPDPAVAQQFSHALEAGILFFSLLFIGPGRYSVDGDGSSAGAGAQRG